MSFFIAAITLGFLGSFHCVGMCGPIALSLPIKKHTSNLKKTSLIILYNSGRIVTYSFFGIVFGLFGQSFRFFGLQQILSVTIGVLILIAFLLPQSIYQKFKITSVVYSFFNQLKSSFSKLFLNEHPKSLFSIGLLNGFLPCGLVYMAAAGAVLSGEIIKGALFMAFFGLGTLPAMILVSSFKNAISISFRNSMRKTLPIITIVMACFLIIRGLNLGIPYLSPKASEIETCHTSTNQIHLPHHDIICTGQNSQPKK